jgi:O-antigen/teichoic acid export membrane protein
VTDPEERAVESAAEVLESRTAGGKVIRGGALRTGGYLAGTGLAAVASIFLLRYLGVDDFGRYVTVMSVLAIVTGITDVGLTIVGQREYAVASDEAARQRLLADMFGIRLVATPLGVVGGALFGLAAGYDSVLVLGILVGGAGLVLAAVAATLTVPLTVNLRFGAATAAEVSRQLAIAVGIAVLVIAGASLLSFFAVQIAAGLLTLAATVALVGRAATPPPRFAVREWVPLLKEAAPVAASAIVNVVYVRLLVVICSLIATATATGLFATSYRIVETFVGIPGFMIGAAFPVLAHAGASDEERLAYGLQRVGEVALLVSLGIALALAFAAEPLVRVLGGAEYADAAPVLSIQAFALVGAFMTQVWALGLVAIRRQSALILVNVIALATVLVLGLTLIPAFDEQGAAIAAVVGETVLAVSLLVMLTRARPALRPALGYVWRLALAAAVASAVTLIAGLPPAPSGVLAGVLYLGLAWALRAVPVELLEQLFRRRPAEDG